MKALNELNLITRVSIILLNVVAVTCAGIWFRVSQVDEPSWRRAGMDAAYRELVPEGAWSIDNRRYETRQVFTDSVARYRFDGANEKLVYALIARYDLSPTDQRRESLFPAPVWWNPPDDGVTYMHGGGHQYRMLVHDRSSGRVFFESTQD
jgi:hypothetical protein